MISFFYEKLGKIYFDNLYYIKIGSGMRCQEERKG
ncbi:Uncharacterised protein [Clostridioides difficile]|nr:hypothetical protein PCZ31_3715 [Clostridioides difficile]OMK57886.1 hypothetical protein BER45_003461 [Clostridioides difficile]SJN93626.1 Uncharacterised protein [Clostridioides difficile]SJR03499.1 Uncharacterised protein [Clostridioides difficile]SJU28268.1 Uncharacterised protein [Clostridioides difficile]